MSLTRDDHSVRINGHAVSVTGTTGSIEAKWTLSVDGQEVASTKAASGQFVLETELPDGARVQAFVRQGAFGPTRVVVHHDGEEITSFKGFVA